MHRRRQIVKAEPGPPRHQYLPGYTWVESCALLAFGALSHGISTKSCIWWLGSLVSLHNVRNDLKPYTKSSPCEDKDLLHSLIPGRRSYQLILNMFCQLTCFILLSWLATAIAQVAVATGGQDYESFDVSTGCTLSDCADQDVGSIYEYPEYTSSPTVECTSTKTQISIMTRGPEISQTLDGCATLKDDAGV